MTFYYLIILSISLFIGENVQADVPIFFQGRIHPLKTYEVLNQSNRQECFQDCFKKQDKWQKEIENALSLKKRADKNNSLIARELHDEFPLERRIEALADTPGFLPMRHAKKTWGPLSALGLQEFDEKDGKLIPVRNFTLYDDATFASIQQYYLQKDINRLTERLESAYVSALAGNILEKTAQKTLYYPSQLQLEVEKAYYQFPWHLIVILLFGSSLFFTRASNLLHWIAFVLLSLVLAVRSYILMRPPVSNMFETALFVPWIIALLGSILFLLFKKRSLLFASSAGSSIILSILLFSGMADTLDNVQPVLDSQFWLTIHVLMVVASYGVFILGGLISHLYLVRTLFLSKKSLKSTEFIILQTLYIGTALLICGTILGGVWAAQSWGRFWDWDPKESWAFISSCLYLLIIHSYRFRLIAGFGLAVGSIAGLAAISFTWYGVNYVLGTGLHSYGFGSGGEHFYWIYLLIEAIFLAIIAVKRYTLQPMSK